MSEDGLNHNFRPAAAYFLSTEKGPSRYEHNDAHEMARTQFVAALFPILRYATGAVDWFRNQAIDADAIVIAAQSPQGDLRAPQRGDNMRTDLKWVVALNLDEANIGRAQALATLQREGGVILKRIPDDLPVTNRRP